MHSLPAKPSTNFNGYSVHRQATLCPHLGLGSVHRRPNIMKSYNRGSEPVDDFLPGRRTEAESEVR